MIIRLGETRQVGIEIISRFNEEFEIQDATVALYDNLQNKLNDLLLDIQGHKMITLITADKIGAFYVVFTYRIGNEILKAPVSVRVMR